MLFQATLVVMGVATFSFVFASFYYYGSSLGGRIEAGRVYGYARDFCRCPNVSSHGRSESMISWTTKSAAAMTESAAP